MTVSGDGEEQRMRIADQAGNLDGEGRDNVLDRN